MSNNTYKKIGLFDSGVGGLSVLKQFASSQDSPMQFVYLGDTARCPYGNRDKTEIESFVQEIIAFLTNFQLDAIVMACNTSAALAKDVAVEAAKRVPSLALFDLIEPTAQYICTQKTIKKLGVMATHATVKAKAFSQALTQNNFDGTVVEVACPLLVPIIESGRLAEIEVQEELKSALRPYLNELKGSDAIVLGCTHFPFVESFIKQLIETEFKSDYPADMQLIDPAVVLCQEVFKLTSDKNIAANYLSSAFSIYTTGSAEAFKAGAEACLGEPMPLPKVVPTTELKATDMISFGVSEAVRG
ncbi:MAG: glutamate racemase [Candidatus Obscuribacter sp.]|nr:glutamate racemase [Candidatus Obscuribacter sp.]MBP7579154.1 glutamate racemase [Candidatus Obscuribacter sp.]